MGIGGCTKLKFKVHPICNHSGGGLVQETEEDQAILKGCEDANKRQINLDRFKIEINKKNMKNKMKPKNKSKRKSQKKRKKMKKRRRKKAKRRTRRQPRKRYR